MPNLWKQFEDLLPDSPRLIGVIATVHSDGTCSVSPLDGGLLRVRGESVPGQRVFVRDGRIEGEAPDLPAVDIAI